MWMDGTVMFCFVFCFFFCFFDDVWAEPDRMRIFLLTIALLTYLTYLRPTYDMTAGWSGFRRTDGRLVIKVGGGRVYLWVVDGLGV